MRCNVSFRFYTVTRVIKKKSGGQGRGSQNRQSILMESVLDTLFHFGDFFLLQHGSGGSLGAMP